MKMFAECLVWIGVICGGFSLFAGAVVLALMATVIPFGPPPPVVVVPAYAGAFMAFTGLLLAIIARWRDDAWK